ncbi:E3 binding domain-containing protein [Chitinophaga sedimenti]|uniref:biotin/lipoyl-containing protein n=1 Tax=Chitinophaga sedimenti TaxID=2033606 RepID=UPI0020042CA2|nr:biotin/lipoyl-containing protein [Chitinophaga sedimenti]MCK7556660.1 E3 binding domain-containing protein [Chitinophaga sedimenti]
MEATILRWHKKPGDKVSADETVLEIATDKVDSDVPSIADGEIAEILFNENDVVPVGTVIARIKTVGEDAPAASPATGPVTAAPAEKQFHAPVRTETPAAAAPSGEARFYSPLVLTIAQQEGLGFAELEKIPGSGSEGRVTKKTFSNILPLKRPLPPLLPLWKRSRKRSNSRRPDLNRWPPRLTAVTWKSLKWTACAS